MSDSDIGKILKEISEIIISKNAELQPLQLKIIENALENATQALGAKDTFVSLESTNFLMWEYTILNAQSEIFALASNRGANSGHGFSINKKLLDIQKKAIANGVKIHRIFSINEAQYKSFDFMELLRAQLNIGIDVWISPENSTEYMTAHQEYDNENYVIADSKILYRSFTENGTSRNSVSFDTELVERYKDMFEQLKGHAYQFQKEDLPKSYNDI